MLNSSFIKRIWQMKLFKKQRDHYGNAKSFEPVIKNTGAEFRAYPDSASTEADFASRTNNLVSVTVFLLERWHE